MNTKLNQKSLSLKMANKSINCTYYAEPKFLQ